MFKKLLAILLACLLALPCGVALAEETLTCGDFEYSINDDGSATIVKYNGEEGDLTIPAELDGHSVTSIGDEVLYDCDFLTSVTIADSVNSIGNEAFSRCDSLTAITIPDSVTSIGANPFAYCKQLTQINISPDHPTLATIDGVLLEKATKKLICYPCAFTAETYTIPQEIQAIGDRAFSYCDSLSSVIIPDSVTSIGDLAFLYCTSLSSIDLPSSLTFIGTEAFYNCDSLTSVTIPNSVTSIGSNPFVACDQLTQITVFPDHPTLGTISGVLYDKTNHKLICYPCAFTAESYEIPQGIEAIGDFAFVSCNALNAVTLPDSVTSIGNVAFVWCDSLTSIVIPDSVTTIANQAFYSCDSLTLTVSKGSYAETYAVENGIPHTN